MAATLVTRPGDPQALKAAAAAALADIDLAVLSLSDRSSWSKLLREPTTGLGSGNLLLVLPCGDVLSEPNAMARWCGEAPCCQTLLY